MKKSFWGYDIFSVLCVIINFIYAQFSHEVSSNYMTYMFLYPLVLGVIASLINQKNNKVVSDIFLCGILTLTMGSFLQGIFEIAGTSSPFQIVFYILGMGLMLVGLIVLALQFITNK